VIKLVYRFMHRGMKKLTGREAAHDSGIEPVEIWAIQPRMMSGMGKFQQTVRKAHSVDERLKYLVELKGSDDRLRVLRRPGLADLPQLRPLRRRFLRSTLRPARSAWQVDECL
jgi:hypothetical protein